MFEIDSQIQIEMRLKFSHSLLLEYKELLNLFRDSIIYIYISRNAQEIFISTLQQQNSKDWLSRFEEGAFHLQKEKSAVT